MPDPLPSPTDGGTPAPPVAGATAEQASGIQEKPVPIPRVLKPGYRFFLWTRATPRRRRLWELTYRAGLVAALLIFVTAAIYPELTSTNSAAQDPCTITEWVVVPAGNVTGLTCNVDGGDWLQGNFTVQDPSGASAEFSVVPSATGSWLTEINGSASEHSDAVHNGNIYYTAPYTDNFQVLWYNAEHNSTERIYLNLEYFSSLPPV